MTLPTTLPGPSLSRHVRRVATLALLLTIFRPPDVRAEGAPHLRQAQPVVECTATPRPAHTIAVGRHPIALAVGSVKCPAGWPAAAGSWRRAGPRRRGRAAPQPVRPLPGAALRPGRAAPPGPPPPRVAAWLSPLVLSAAQGRRRRGAPRPGSAPATLRGPAAPPAAARRPSAPGGRERRQGDAPRL